VASASSSSASSTSAARTIAHVATALVEIERDELRSRIERGDDFVLVDALAPLSYGAAHLPGAVNIPPERVDALAERRIPSRETPVVVYCAGPDCDSSVEVARRLLELGYRDVAHYAGGKRDWADAGLPVETSARLDR
jgi:rhodanese-related sulfurtransferase